MFSASASNADSQIYNKDYSTSSSVQIEIDTSGQNFEYESVGSSGRYAGVAAEGASSDNSVSYTVSASGLSITADTESVSGRLYGLAAVYGTLTVNSDVSIDLSMSEGSGDIRAVRSNYGGTIIINGNLTATVSSYSSNASYILGFDNWGNGINGSVDMYIYSDSARIYGVQNTNGGTINFNGDFALSAETGENNYSYVQGYWGNQSTTNFNSDATITVKDNYTEIESGKVAAAIWIECDDGDEYDTVVNFYGDTTLSTTTVGKDTYVLCASGTPGSINFYGETATVTAKSTDGSAYGLWSQYGATIYVSSDTDLSVTAASSTENAIAVGQSAMQGYNGSIVIEGDSVIAASSDSSMAIGVYNYGVSSYNGTGTVTISGDVEINTTTDSGYAFGVYAYGETKTTLSGSVEISAEATGDGVSYGIYAESGSLGEAEVSIGSSDNTVYISADCAVYTYASGVAISASSATLDGDVYADIDSKITVEASELSVSGDLVACSDAEITITTDTTELGGGLYAEGGSITITADELSFTSDVAYIEAVDDGSVTIITDSAIANAEITGSVIALETGFTVLSGEGSIIEGSSVSFAGNAVLSGSIYGDDITVSGTGNSATEIFCNSIIFNITSEISSGDVMLSVQTADLSGTAISAYAEAGDYLYEGYKVTLLSASEGLTSDDETSYTGSLVEGVSIEYDLDVYKDGDAVIAEITGGSLRDETKSLVETRIGQAAMLDQSADLISSVVDAGTGLTLNPNGWSPFVSFNAGTYKYDTGSYVDIEGFNFAVGLMKDFLNVDVTFTLGAAFQYGKGEYDSYVEGVNAEGDTEYSGAALFAKKKWSNGLYAEASISAGYSQADYFSDEMFAGMDISYDVGSKYWRAHVGFGKEFALNAMDRLDVYGKYFYSELDSASARLSSGEVYNFDEVDSSRLRVGVRFTRDINETGKFYVGAAYQYQFDGDANAAYRGYSTQTPSLEGSSGMLELGVQFSPKNSPVSLGLGMNTWVGSQEGVEGSLKFKWDL